MHSTADNANDTAVRLLQSGRANEAVAVLVPALKRAPSALLYYHLGLALHALGLLPAALESFIEAARLQPAFADAQLGIATTQLDLGLAHEAVQAYEKAHALAPDRADIHSGWLLAMQYLPEVSAATLEQAHRAYGARFDHSPAMPSSTAPVRPADATPLRIGFVSGDLRNHPVGTLVKGVLESLAGPSVALFFYPSHASHAQDEVAQALRALGAWRPVEGLSDEAAARLIRADGIQILVDLSGHTGHNRLPVFALRPAPVQVSWLGYTATTGMRSIDYLICDAVSVPDVEQSRYSETLWRIPGSRLCFSPPTTPVEVGLPPLQERHYPTFGCFNNTAKLNDAVAQLWADLLRKVPQARLFLKGRQFDHAIARKAVLERFERAGIARERIDVEGFAPRAQGYYEAYRRVDVALDPFPFTGGTTTLDALWMGVPVVTLRGDSLVSRQGESVLTALGRSEWIARSADEYVFIAQQLVADAERLTTLRGGLREALLRSPLGDVTAYAAQLGDAFRAMWMRHCGLQ